MFGELFGGASGDDATTLVTTFGTHIDNPVGGADDMEVVFDDNHGIAAIDKSVEDAEKAIDIVGVETGGGFIKNVESVASGATREFGGEFDALGFAARESGGGLAEFDVAEADGLEGGEFFGDARDISKEFYSLVDGHIKDGGDVFVFIFNFEGFAIVAFAMAGGAGDIDVG